MVSISFDINHPACSNKVYIAIKTEEASNAHIFNRRNRQGRPFSFVTNDINKAIKFFLENLTDDFKISVLGVEYYTDDDQNLALSGEELEIAYSYQDKLLEEYNKYRDLL
jgi:hypothetical protein